MLMLIGSRALAFRAPHLLAGRKPNDFDFIATEESALKWLQDRSIENWTKEDGKIIVRNEPGPCIEFELAENRKTAAELLELVKNDPETLHNEKFGMIPSLNVLFVLKTSHRFLKNSPHFWKTAVDWHRMRAAGCEVPKAYESWLKLRESETYNYALPRLNVSKDEFFEMGNVPMQFEHDDVHVSVQRGSCPAYMLYLKEGCEVACDKEKFFALPYEVRLNGVIEEAAVLAIERSLTAFPGVKTPKEAWIFALSKVCTGITKGWFREFAFQNVFEVLQRYPEGYWEKFQEDVRKGLVRPYIKPEKKTEEKVQDAA